jgi:hypothetical protein
MRTIVALAALTLAAAPALAEDWDFVLINDAGKPIKTIEIAVAGSGAWKPNVKAEDIADRGAVKVKARTTVHFDKPSGQCKFDIKATFEDGTSQVWNAANVCDASFVTVKLVGGKATIVTS